MEIKDSEEIIKKLKALEKSTIKNRFFITLKICSLLCLSNILVTILSTFYVQSQAFLFVGMVLNAFFILSKLNRDMNKEHDRLVEETKKILK